MHLPAAFLVLSALLASSAGVALPGPRGGAGGGTPLVLLESTAFVDSLVIVDGSTVDPPGIGGTALSFNETSETALGPALGRSSLRSSLTSGARSLVASASGNCRSQVAITGEREVDIQRFGGAAAQIVFVFSTTERATFSVSGSVSAAGDNGVQVDFSTTPVSGTSSFPLALFVEGGRFQEEGADSGSASGELEPGTHSVLANCGTGAPRNEDLASVGNASFQFSLTVDVPEAGDVFRWVGPSAGAFGDDGNWDPEGPATAGVPSFVPGTRSDTALFRGGRVRLDIAALSAASRGPRGVAAQCAGPVSRTIGRLLLDSADLEPVNGPLKLDSLSLDEPSLTLEDNGFLDLRETALCARHARIGAGGRPSLAIVSGPGGVLQSLGRLSVGGGGEGTLRVLNAGIASSEEVLVGDGDEKGLAVVSDATWQTGNLAVGFQSSGELLVENAGLLESEGGFVDRDLDPSSGNTALATVRGAGSFWHLDELKIGGRGIVEIEEGGRLETPNLASSGRVDVGQVDDSGEATLLVNQGGVLRTQSLEVGSFGAGLLIVGETFDRNPRVDADFALFVGSPFGRGRVQLAGDPSTDDFSLVADEFQIGVAEGARGELTIEFGGKALTSTDAFVGSEGGSGIVRLLGAPIGNPELLTVWQISENLILGGPSQPARGILLIRDASVDVGTISGPGSVVIDEGGAIVGTGSRLNRLRVVGGLITNDGLITGPVTLDGRYDPASTGTIASAFAGLPPAPLQLAGRSPAGALAALGAPRRKPPPPAQGPVVFTGDAELGGTLVLQFLNGFAPAQGSAFEVVEAGGSVIGGFSEVVVQGLAPGALFEDAVQDGVLTLTSVNGGTALPTVSLKAKAKLKEKAKQGAVTFKRSGDTSEALAVSYQVGGSAANGVDYQLLSGVLEIPAGKKSAKLLLRPFRDGLPEAPETLEIELVPGGNYAPSLLSKVSIELVSSD